MGTGGLWINGVWWGWEEVRGEKETVEVGAGERKRREKNRREWRWERERGGRRERATIGRETEGSGGWNGGRIGGEGKETEG